jgi:hypothetical protein
MANSVDHSVDDTVCRCVAAITQVSVSGRLSITHAAHPVQRGRYRIMTGMFLIT